MPLLFLLLFIGVPIVEIAVFIEVGGWLGLWPTLAVIILTAVAGTTLLRWQGLSILARAKGSLERGELPLAEVFDGACLLVAGVLLLTPGFVTDGLGGLLFLPPFRAALRGLCARFVAARTEVRTSGGGGAGDQIIEGEWEEVYEDHDDDALEPPPSPNKWGPRR